MPNRIIKESICTSNNIDSLSPMEEIFFYRLIVNCDDYGRLDARPQILRAKCFPLKIDQVKDSDVNAWTEALVKAGLIITYTVNDILYLQMATWRKHQQVRASKSKYPAPDESCNQLISDEINGNHPNTNVPVTRNRIRESESKNICASDDALCPPVDENEKIGAANEGDEYPPEFEEFWTQYPRRVNKGKALRNWRARTKSKRYSPGDMVAAAQHYAEHCVATDKETRYIMHPATFLGPDQPFREWILGPPEPAGGQEKEKWEGVVFDNTT